MLPTLTLNYWAQCSLLLGLQTHSIVPGIDTLTRRLCNQASLSLLSTASAPSPTAYLEEFEHLVGALEPSLNYLCVLYASLEMWVKLAINSCQLPFSCDHLVTC